jgi:predicted dehydrogenase
LAKKHGFVASTTDNNAIYTDSEIDLVMITTRHNKHADQVIQSLQAGKHVFVEKPLAINTQDLEQILSTYNFTGPRFSPG